MSKHTPGPWVIIPPDHEDLRPKWYVEKPDGKDVAGYCIADVYETEEGEGKDNARLIAAAPDMLDELKSILKVLEARKIGLHRQETIRQVIAKATS